jgi:hypothetical protein
VVRFAEFCRQRKRPTDSYQSLSPREHDLGEQLSRLNRGFCGKEPDALRYIPHRFTTRSHPLPFKGLVSTNPRVALKVIQELAGRVRDTTRALTE